MQGIKLSLTLRHQVPKERFLIGLLNEVKGDQRSRLIAEAVDFYMKNCKTPAIEYPEFIEEYDPALAAYYNSDQDEPQ